MSRLGSYKNTAFNESQKFLVLDPSTSSASLVLASELVAYITPKIGSVKAESTRLSAENTDYKVGEIIQTSGATVVGSLAAVYLVVAGGAGDFPMLNGNDLLVLIGDDALRAQLISEGAGQGASLVSMNGGPTVESAVTAAEVAILNRVIRVASRTEMKAYDVPAGYQFSLEEGGRSGIFVVKTGSPPIDPQEGVNVVLNNGNYAMRLYNGIINVEWFGAVGNGILDNAIPLQAAADYRSSGVIKASAGTFNTTLPLILNDNVSLIGESRDSTTIVKTTSGTKNPTITIGTYITEIYEPVTIPANINAILILDGAGGRYTGQIKNIKLSGLFSSEPDKESQIVEFGILSIGSVSDIVISEVDVSTVQYGVLLQTIFASTIKNMRISTSLHGIGINTTSTSLTLSNNYVNSARDYGYYLRSLLYSTIQSNACDSLNREDYYPDRTRTCAGYTFRSVRGCSITANGQESTRGTNWRFITVLSSVVKGNISASLGSDYTGADEIAWMYFDNNLQDCDVANNVSISYSSSGLLFGGASGAQHHNIYFEGQSFVSDNEFKNNIVKANETGSSTEAGWLNNVPSNWLNVSTGGERIYTITPTLSANTQGDLSVVYNSDNVHYAQQIGQITKIFGKFDVTVTYTTAGSFLIINGLPTNSPNQWRIGVTGVENGDSFTRQLKGFRLNSSTAGGIAFANDETPFNITDIPSGETAQIFYEATYRNNKP
jgi:hypothetical protein